MHYTRDLQIRTVSIDPLNIEKGNIPSPISGIITTTPPLARSDLTVRNSDLLSGRPSAAETLQLRKLISMRLVLYVLLSSKGFFQDSISLCDHQQIYSVWIDCQYDSNLQPVLAMTICEVDLLISV